MDLFLCGAHPDDIEFGMGASLIKFLKEGRSAVLCILTRGGSGSYGSPEIREKEMRRSAELMGTCLEILDLTDCNVFDTFENRCAMASLIRKYQPKVIFAPYPWNYGPPGDGSAHPDHTAAGILARNAARYARFRNLPCKGGPWQINRMFYYMLPRSMTPDFILDVTDFMPEWEKTASCHQSQLELRGGQVIEYLKRIRSSYGLLCGAEYAEGFAVDEPAPLNIADFL